MPKILHMSSTSEWRGGEQQIAYLMSELAHMGCENLVFCPEESALHQWSISNGFKCIPYKKGSSISLPTSRLFKRTCNTENIDLVHIHDSHSHNYAWLSSSIFGNPVPMVLSRRVNFSVKYSSTRKYNLKNIQKIICVSDFVKGVVASRVKDKSKLLTIRDGVELIQSDERFIRKQFNISKDEIIIGCVAALSEEKDHTTLVNAARIIIKDFKLPVKFLLIGQDGGLKEKIQEQIIALELSEHFIICGFIEDVRKYIHELDYFLLTSKEEGLGSSILDAYNAKIPVVCTNAGGIPEIVTHKLTGMMAQVGDPEKIAEYLKYLYNNESFKDRLLQNAFQYVQGLSKTAMAKRTLKIYQNILDDKEQHIK